MWNKVLTIGVVLTSMVMIACGTETADKNSDALDHFFPESIPEVALERGDEIRLFVGDSLWEYINGGAELYHTYGFIDVTTADYRSAKTEIVVDLYRFGTAEGAYGLYSALRPEEPDLAPYGAEGYRTGSSLEYVKGEIMVRIIAYDESEATQAALAALANHMNETLTGTTETPSMFGLFPTENAVPHSDRIVGEGFLGQAFLKTIYTRDYLFEEENVTLFLATDHTGAMLVPWFERVTETEKSPPSVADLPYDETYYLQTSNDFYGQILAGLVNEKLAGVVNFSDQQKPFVAEWLRTVADHRGDR